MTSINWLTSLIYSMIAKVAECDFSSKHRTTYWFFFSLTYCTHPPPYTWKIIKGIKMLKNDENKNEKKKLSCFTFRLFQKIPGFYYCMIFLPLENFQVEMKPYKKNIISCFSLSRHSVLNTFSWLKQLNLNSYCLISLREENKK